MAAVGDEVARGDRATVPGGRHKAELRDDLSCDVAQSHQAACGATDPLDIFEQLSICIQPAASFMPGLPEIPCTGDHHGHREVDARDLYAFDLVEHLAGRQQLAGLLAHPPTPIHANWGACSRRAA